MSRYYNDDYLMHYGVQGMKWGIRRYVNYDGTLTAEGRKKYGTYQNFAKSSEGRKMLAQSNTQRPATTTPRYTKNQNGVQTRQAGQQPKKGLSTKQKVAIGATVTASALAIVGTAVLIRNHHNMMEHESELGKKAVQEMSAFDKALNSYKETARNSVKPNVAQKVTETARNSVKPNVAQKVTETVAKSAQTREANIDDLLAQLSQDSKGGTGKGASFKKAAQSVDDLTAELLKSNRRHLS